MARASAQAYRSAEPECSTDRLPEVTPSLGLMAVLAGTMRTRARSTSSSSATIWATAVRMPWPISTLPENTSTMPSAPQPQPLRQPPIGLQAAGQRRRAALVDDVIAETRTRAHAAAPSLAARSTARTMRLCAPQRHRLRSSAPRTSASLGSGLRFEQRGGGDQNAGDAVAALHGLLGDEGPLQRMRPLRRAETFDRRDVLAGGGPQRRIARGHGLAVQQHVAGAALVGAAAEMRGRQPERAAQHAEQGRFRSGLDRPLHAVHAQPDRAPVIASLIAAS